MSSVFEERFKERYAQLNKKQKLAVDTIEGPVMVIAGPGTGKTSILTLRIANILKQTDTPPSGILAITFTDAGVKAMKSKLREIIGGRADEVRIHTFHGFASSIISEFKDHFTHLDEVSQMTDIDSDGLVRKIIEASEFQILRPIGKPDFYVSSIIKSISDAKREAFTPEDIKEFSQKEIKRINSDESLISTRGATKGELKADAKKTIEKLEKTIVFADVYAQYEALKKENKLMDFDDLILELVLALGRDELLLRLVQEKFLYILVDEHQDTNDSQNLIIKLVADFFENPNIFIVGDEKQAIYRFQGASVENFLRFEKTWPEMTVISLEENYRSHQHILDASFGMIEKNYIEDEHGSLRVKLKSGGKQKSKLIDVAYPEDVDTGEHYLVSELKRITKEEPNKTVAVISRKNLDVDRLIHLFEGEGLPVSAERSIDIFSHPIGMIFFSLVSFLNNPLDVEAFGKTVVAGLWNLNFTESVEILKNLRKSGRCREDPVEGPSTLIKNIKKLMIDDSPMLFIIRTAEESGLTSIISRDPSYVEVWRGILDFVEQVIRQDDIHSPAMLLEKLSAYKVSSESKKVKVSVGTTETPIKVVTAHGSKGLEYDYVFIPYATEESWLPKKFPSYFILPTSKLEKDGDTIRDARRLFYVAITRAREHVVILAPFEDAGGKLLTSLRFIDELDKESLKQVEVIDKRDHSLIPQVAKKDEKANILNYAKNTLIEKGLSVTALNHFLKCPREFIFKSILKIPEAPSLTAEKGIAMHLACDRIWSKKDVNISEESVREIIETAINDSLEKSHLRSFEKEAVKTELLKNAPKVAKSLLPHFHTAGEVFTETWSETKFKNITLHGKLDAVIDTGKDILVFDYKTKGKMSVNEIKGDTKSSDGGYFRQLVFYRLLLEAQHKFEGKNIIPALVFLTPDEKGVCHIQAVDIEQKDIDSLRVDIQSLIDSVWSGEVLSKRCDDEKCPWCAMSSFLL
ncbi:MAG: ATP-dependent DNA helicase [Candidatus Paceibacterota bacterium]|jgi:DNA helicase-2/ATP-dependent DNA helicase PcrA